MPVVRGKARAIPTLATAGLRGSKSNLGSAEPYELVVMIRSRNELVFLLLIVDVCVWLLMSVC